MSWNEPLSVACAVVALTACGSVAEKRFPLRAPISRDTDLTSVVVPCRSQPTPKDPHHISCAPEVYESPVIWDGADSLVFRPMSEFFAVEASTESVNVNSLDEVPDSSWFTNRIGVRPMSIEELERGGCDPALYLEPAGGTDGTWVVDKGKAGGSTSGFRVSVPGKGKYMFKADDPGQPERPSAASIIGIAVYHAAGYNTTCEQIVYFKPSLLKLKPGLRFRGNFGDEKDFDEKALVDVLSQCPKRGGLVRMQASAWLPGQLLGAFRYEGTRADDPNDVVPHENRRELRGGRLLAAWLDRVDAREGNTMDAWIADRVGPPDSSPGHVIHSYLDTSESLGPGWQWEEITRRMGYSYVFDWGDLAQDFFTLGIPIRPWDRVKVVPGRELFVYFNVEDFVPDQWKMEYSNPAFSRMTERDGAWMARILSRFTPEMVVALAQMAQFTDTGNTTYLAGVLEGRLERILERYLTRLSPIADVRVEGADTLCGVDLAEWRHLRDAASFRYVARWSGGGALPVSRRSGARACVTLPHVAKDGGPVDDAPERYVRVSLEDGVAKGQLLVYLYDLGPRRGYRVAGLERPNP